MSIFNKSAFAQEVFSQNNKAVEYGKVTAEKHAQEALRFVQEAYKTRPIAGVSFGLMEGALNMGICQNGQEHNPSELVLNFFIEELNPNAVSTALSSYRKELDAQLGFVVPSGCFIVKTIEELTKNTEE